MSPMSNPNLMCYSQEVSGFLDPLESRSHSWGIDELKLGGNLCKQHVTIVK
jgi:hypothetical protein